MISETQEVAVIGAGGHGKVVIGLLQELGFKVSMILDDDPRKWGTRILSVPVKGPIKELVRTQASRAIIGIGENRTRLQVAKDNEGLHWVTAVHPYSWVHPSVKIGEGSVVFAGCVIQPDTIIGKHCIINTGATIDHDCRIADGVHIAPGSHLAGNTVIGEGSFLGVGVSVIPGCTIGKGVTIGAGATVTGDIPDLVVAVGTPARPIRSLILGREEG